MGAVDNILDVAKRVATSVWGDGAARGLMTTEKEIGSNIVNGAEHRAAKDMLHTLKRNGASFDEDGISKMMEASFKGNDTWNRDDIFSGLKEHMTDESRDKALDASADAIKAYQEGGGKVQKYIDDNNVPQNALHKKGFVSIGCAPCTRAIAEGEDIRAGRWSWESSHKECGLHQK